MTGDVIDFKSRVRTRLGLEPHPDTPTQGLVADMVRDSDYKTCLFMGMLSNGDIDVAGDFGDLEGALALLSVAGATVLQAQASYAPEAVREVLVVEAQLVHLAGLVDRLTETLLEEYPDDYGIKGIIAEFRELAADVLEGVEVDPEPEGEAGELSPEDVV